MSQGYDNFFAAAKKAKSNQYQTKARPHVQKNLRKSALKKSDPSKPTSAELALRAALNLKSKRRKPRVPVVAVATSIVGLMVSLLAFVFVDDLEEFISRVEVNWFTSAGAAQDQGQKEKSSPAKDKKQENIAKSENSEKEKPADQVQDKNGVDFNYLSKLADRKKQLDQREQELAELEEELHKQREEIEGRIQYLQDVRREIAGILKERVDIDEQKINKLVDVYSNMKPQQAAGILSDLNDELAVQILGRMKKKNAAEILNLLKPEKAKMLSERYAGYKGRQ